MLSGVAQRADYAALLGELHAMVPAYTHNFWWTDALGNCTNVYQENFDETAAVLPVFFSEFFNNDRMSEVLRNVPESVMRDRGVKTLARSSREYRNIGQTPMPIAWGHY